MRKNIMNTPIINIQEAAVLYVNMKRTNPDSFSKTIKSIPPYKTTVLIHQDVIADIEIFFIQKVTQCHDITKISTFIIKDNKPADWLGSVEFPDKEEGWERSGWPEGMVSDINPYHDSDFWWSVLDTRTSVVLFALTLMNCKNISYAPHDPNKGVSLQKKGRCKKFKKAYIKYEILEIQPMKERKTNKTKSESPVEVENNHRLHTVRGHLKTYTAEKPLFGRLTGTYWWGDCIKGNAEIGIIEKDYNLRIKMEDFKKTMCNIQGGAYKC
jgi:hypothetical protein